MSCGPGADDGASVTAGGGAAATHPADGHPGGAAADGGAAPAEAALDAAPSTLAMVARLAELAEHVDPTMNGYANRRRVVMHRRELERDDLTESERTNQRLTLGVELMLAGDAAAAVDELSDLLDALGEGSGPEHRRQVLAVREQLALAWLRLGEQENCILHHGTESCLMPIAGSGLHGEQRGSRNALTQLLALLERRPTHYGAIWLANLAAMTLDEWPAALPERFRIDPDNFRSEADIGRFVDVARESGADVDGLAGGVCLEDLDGDGALDLLVSSWGPTDPLRYLQGTGDGHFVDRTSRAGLAGLGGGLNTIHADYDNDGLSDVLVLRGAWLGQQGLIPNSLLHNEGGGRFTDVTEQAGMLSFHPTQTAAWGDYDGDGWLDLYVGNESAGENAHPCELWHNQGDGTFVDVAPLVGADVVAWVKGVAFGDVDDDGLLDLYLSNLEGPNALLHNDGPRDGRPVPLAAAPETRGDGLLLERLPAAAVRPWRFRDVAAEAGVTEPAQSFPTWFFDYDNDGDLDLWVCGYWGSVRHICREALGLEHNGALPRLYRNRGDGRFDDVTREARLDRLLMAMGANHGDLDNDGWQDLYLGTGQPSFMDLYPNRMFRSDGGAGGGPLSFQDVTTSGGFGHVQKGHGIAFGDVDRDGDQDIYAVMGGAFEGDRFRNALFRNPGHDHHWISLRLEGRRANRSALGARVCVTLDLPGGGTREVFGQVDTGSSFGSDSLQVELGLGDAAAVREVRITWPGGGHVQRLGALAMDRAYRVREGEPALAVEG